MTDLYSNFKNNMDIYLQPTEFIDCDNGTVIEFTQSVTGNSSSDIGKAVKLYYAVRDEIKYDPYRIDLSRKEMKASTVLMRKYGFCITKAVLLAAAGRAAGIPCRLGFADVKNHLTSERLYALMKTDIFAFHGYTDFYLEGKWVKATPAFNRQLCEKTGVKTLEFDGKSDSIFHQFDKNGNKHIEYVKDRGKFADLPYDEICEVFSSIYPHRADKKIAEIDGDFEKEAVAGD